MSFPHTPARTPSPSYASNPHRSTRFENSPRSEFNNLSTKLNQVKVPFSERPRTTSSGYIPISALDSPSSQSSQLSPQNNYLLDTPASSEYSSWPRSARGIGSSWRGNGSCTSSPRGLGIYISTTNGNHRLDLNRASSYVECQQNRDPSPSEASDGNFYTNKIHHGSSFSVPHLGSESSYSQYSSGKADQCSFDYAELTPPMPSPDVLQRHIPGPASYPPAQYEIDQQSIPHFDNIVTSCTPLISLPSMDVRGQFNRPSFKESSSTSLTQISVVVRSMPNGITKKKKVTNAMTMTSYSSKDNPYACNITGCTRRFKRQEHLKRHEITHFPQIRPFECEAGCGKSFSRRDNLKQHHKTHMARTGRNRNAYVEGFAPSF